MVDDTRFISTQTNYEFYCCDTYREVHLRKSVYENENDEMMLSGGREIFLMSTAAVGSFLMGKKIEQNEYEWGVDAFKLKKE